ncbi:MAG: 4Fe-4S binding protein [Candidatus Kapabacteria bacterium]|nr:4Fe-4S binding protein [Candidatus Kapabacteria bacterium]
MFKLILHAKECISCAICVDVCIPEVLLMREYTGKTIEGKTQLKSFEFDTELIFEISKLSFPFLLNPNDCNGCMECVNECPVMAIEIQQR